MFGGIDVCTEKIILFRIQRFGFRPPPHCWKKVPLLALIPSEGKDGNHNFLNPVQNHKHHSHVDFLHEYLSVQLVLLGLRCIFARGFKG